MNFFDRKPDAPHADDKAWARLLENVRTLALRKSDAMLTEASVEDESFDRDARNLRTLMSAAEIASRLKDHDEEEDRLNANEQAPRERSDEELDALYRRVAASVDRMEREERGGLDRPSQRDPRGDAANGSGGGSGENLEGGRP